MSAWPGIPGVGPITAISLLPQRGSRSVREWPTSGGLDWADTPRAHSSGGKQRLGGISRAGHERLRQLLVVGATAVIRHASKPGTRRASPWLMQLLARKPRKLVAVALANKTARIVWAMMARGEAYRQAPLAGAA